jgi:hypothetical protein
MRLDIPRNQSNIPGVRGQFSRRRGLQSIDVILMALRRALHRRSRIEFGEEYTIFVGTDE